MYPFLHAILLGLGFSLLALDFKPLYLNISCRNIFCFLDASNELALLSVKRPPPVLVAELGFFFICKQLHIQY